jgi:WD40 repeat protein
VWTLAFSPAGGHVVSVSRDGAATVRDAGTGIKAYTLQGHTGLITDAAFSPDGTRLAVGGSGEKIWLWDVATRTLERTFVLPVGGGATLAFSPDGRFLAAGGAQDCTVRIVEVASGHVSKVFPGHTEPIGELTFSPDGTRLASTSYDGTVRLWPLSDGSPGSPAQMLQGHAGPVYAAAFSPDGRTLATGGHDGAVRLWDIATAQEVLTLPFAAGSGQRVAALRFDRSGAALSALGGNGSTSRWSSAPSSETGGTGWSLEKEDFRPASANTAGADLSDPSGPSGPR